MNYWEENGPEEKVFEGRIVEVIKQPMKLVGEGKEMFFEKARRAPGVRLIITRKNKILLTKEYRDEIKSFDYRLPGGKVFDKLSDYQKHQSEDLLPFAEKAAFWEAEEEAGILIKNLKHFSTSVAGSTMVWDLYYFVVDNFEENLKEKKAEDGEEISVEWKNFEEIKEIIMNGKMSEDRSIANIFKFFLKNQI